MLKGSGINNKMVRVFLLQLAFISLVTVTGVMVAAVIVEQVMIRTALEKEADFYWELWEKDNNIPTPMTDNLRGYRTTIDHWDKLPAFLKGVQPGFGRIEMQGRKPVIYVEDYQKERLFLIFDEESVGKLSFYFGVVPLSLALVVIYVSAWFAYRSSQRTLSPLMSLARTMRSFNIKRHNLDSLKLDQYHHAGIDDEVRILAESLETFTQRLKLQLQREREFSHDVSHELRTPLAVISGSLEILDKQPKNPLQQRAIERMQTTSRDMLSLIETLLLLAREDSRQITEQESIIVNEIIPLLMEQIENTHNSDQHVNLVLREEETLKVQASSQIIQIVIGNLLRNACHYTHSGTVTLTLQQNRLSVHDTGSGMTSTELSRATQAFERIPHKTNSHNGYGLGLDIVKRLCERMDWDLILKSRPGEGTEVTVYFHPLTPR